MVGLTLPQAILELPAFLLPHSQLALISGSHVPSGVNSSLWVAGFTFLAVARCSWLLCPQWVGWGQARPENTASQRPAVLRVLSSQLLVLCKLKPSLLVELSREVLEFVGSVSSIRTRTSMFTSVVSTSHLPPVRREALVRADPVLWA